MTPRTPVLDLPPRVSVAAVLALVASSVVGLCAVSLGGPGGSGRDHTPAPTHSAAPSTFAAGRPYGTQAWVENFDGPAGSQPTDTIFQARTGGNGWGNQELESYTRRPSNVSLDGHGHLVLAAVREKYTGGDGYSRNWTSGRLDSSGIWTFRTGSLSIRMKVPGGAGTWPAFWLEGADIARTKWPAAGEIDVVETLGKQRLIFQTMHGPNGSPAGYQVGDHPTLSGGVAPSDGFHTYTVVRAPGSVTFEIDGDRTLVVTPKDLAAGQQWVFDKPMFVLLNLAIGGWAGPPAASSTRHALTVDWIRYDP